MNTIFNRYTAAALLGCATFNVSAFEVNSTSVNSTPATVYSSGYSEPVLILGVPTSSDSQHGALSVTKDASGNAQIAFENWEYLGGSHSDESVPTLLIESGVHTLQDGSIWEAGVIDVSAGQNDVFTFNAAFPHPPYIILTPQSKNSALYTTSLQRVTSKNFKLFLSGQESASAIGSDEKIGYLAVYSPANSGSTDQSLPYEVSQVVMNDQGHALTDSATLVLEEETSSDQETSHDHEVVNVLKVGEHYFATNASSYDSDTNTLRIQEPATGMAGSSCYDIATATPNAADGLYLLDPDGDGGIEPFEAYCDISGGGWTLVARGYGGDVGSWITNRSSAVNEDAVPSPTMTETFMYSDSVINALHQGRQLYRAQADSGDVARYAGGADYCHDTSDNCGGYMGTYANEGLTDDFGKGVYADQYVNIRGGISDSGDTYNLISFENYGSRGWVLYKHLTGSSSWWCGGHQAGCDFSLWVK